MSVVRVLIEREGDPPVQIATIPDGEYSLRGVPPINAGVPIRPGDELVLRYLGPPPLPASGEEGNG